MRACFCAGINLGLKNWGGGGGGGERSICTMRENGNISFKKIIHTYDQKARSICRTALGPYVTINMYNHGPI